MRRVHALATAVAIALTLGTVAGCAAEEPAEPSGQTPAPPATEATTTEKRPPIESEFWTRLQDAGYTEWTPAEGFEEPQRAQGPHGDQVKVYLNPVAEQGLNTGGDSWPAGTIIVKDIYTTGLVTQVAAMEKLESGAWYWGEWNTDGSVVAEGEAIAVCEDCHSKGIDKVLSVSLP